MRTCKLLLRPRPASCCKLQRTFSDTTTIVAFCTEISPELSSIELRQKGFFGWKEVHSQPDTDKELVNELMASVRRGEATQATLSQPIVTELKDATVFWPAEGYHQRYLQKGGQSAEKNAPEKVRCYG